MQSTVKVADKTDRQLAMAQNFQRKAQFYLDFVEAENSTGFHAPQEAARILGESIDFSRKGQIALRDGKAERAPNDLSRYRFRKIHLAPSAVFDRIGPKSNIQTTLPRLSQSQSRRCH